MGLPVKDNHMLSTSRRPVNVSSANESGLRCSEAQVSAVSGEGYLNTCRMWGVVSTVVRSLSISVRRLLQLDEWCVVVVHTAAPEAERDIVLGEQRVVYLNCATGDKNAGYMYAISHGAMAIWDFDDDHMIKFWIKGAGPPGAPSLEEAMKLLGEPEIDAMEPQDHTWPTYNPYPMLGAPVLPSWPRGLPLSDVSKGLCSNTNITRVRVKSRSIAVLQSLSDYRPDADGVYSSMVSIPFFFIRSKETRPLMIPEGVFSPYNTQSTLHFQPGFWALYLPVTVEESLKDIWRSYIAQRLYWDAGLKVGFLPRPLVVHRSDGLKGENRATKGLSDEIQLLVKFLVSWTCKHTKLFVECIEQLWSDLYLAGHVGNQDVSLLKEWLQQLKTLGYTFPILNKSSIKLTGAGGKSLSYMASQDALVTNKWLEKINTQSVSHAVHVCTPAVRTPNTINHTSCTTNAPLTFWTSDIHFGTRYDVPSLLAALGQKVVLAIGNKDDRHPEVLQQQGISINNQVSDVIKTDFRDTSCMNTRLTEQMVQSNFEFFKGQTLIQSTDAFVCLFQPGMCEMWMPFNRTIIFIPAHRYSMGRCTKEEFQRLNEHLFALASMEDPKHVIGASSTYDLEQLWHYTGLDVLPLFSYSGYYVGTHSYKPTREEIPIFVRSNWNDGFKNKIKKYKIVDVKELYPWFKFSDLVNHRAIIYLPYAVMSYKITELYFLNIPLFFPSMKYLQTIKDLGVDRSILTEFWCGGGHKAIGNIKDSDMKPHPCSTHPYSPNLQASQDMEAEYYWLQFADFFVWPHITYFDDFEDLERKLDNANFTAIHGLMVEENRRREKVLRHNWCHVFSGIKTGRNVPHNYAKAIKDLYGVDRLQVY